MTSLTAKDFALLATDAYHRTNEFEILDRWFTSAEDLGDIEVIWTSTELEYEDEGEEFYAVAYRIDGNVILAFRGTDDILADALTGFPVTFGLLPTQAVRAAESYAAVAALLEPGEELQLTGHSLGGALAGFVSAITGTPAHCI